MQDVIYMKNDFNYENKVVDEDIKTIYNAHILLVDDEDFLVKLWKNILEKHGFKVTSYISGESAFEDFKNNPHSFDLVVSDQSMPSITGRELAAELIKIRSDIKIILCTGYLDEAGREKGLSSGICELLLKPFNNNTLISAIKRNLETKK
jgi:CheY-like chemotaxis protein